MVLKRYLNILVWFLACGAFAATQSPSNSPGKPAEVVKRFVKMAQAGSLLTPNGLSEASVLFASPKRPPYILVFDGQFGFGVDDEPMRRTAQPDAVDIVVWDRPAGRIDANLRYSPPSEEVMRSYKSMSLVHVVLTDKYWKIGPDGNVATAATGTKQWRINTLLRWTTVAEAVRYVTEMRDKTNDPVIKKNAERTIAILSKMKD